MFCWNKRCYPRFFFLPSPLQRPRQTNKTKGRLLFCSPLPACHHIHLCCFVSSKCLPLSLRRPAKRPARACAAFQTGKQDRGGGGGGDGELKAGHFDWLSSLVSGQRCIVGWSPGGGSEKCLFLITCLKKIPRSNVVSHQSAVLIMCSLCLLRSFRGVNLNTFPRGSPAG